MLDDNDPEKFQKTGETKMKHKILELYLNPWIKKVSKIEERLLFVDGFAGPGIYPDGNKGSPIIAMDMADKMLSEYDGIQLDSFECIFVENNPGNYEKLHESVNEHEKKVDDRIVPRCINRDFEDWAQDFIDTYEVGSPPPGLVFIDPFGYGDIPFELLTELFQVRETSFEFLITLMTGKMAQWRSGETHEKAISKALGTTDWIDELPENATKDDEAELFADLYQERFKNESGARFTYPFQMIEEQKRQTNYYLIHITNHIDGLSVMKDNMYNAGADDQYAYLGPDHAGYEDEQLSFTEFAETDESDQRIEEFADELYRQYKGQEIRFKELLQQTLDKNVFKRTHYRDAFAQLSKQDKLEINGKPYTKGNNTRCGMKSEIAFLEKATLSDYV